MMRVVGFMRFSIEAEKVVDFCLFARFCCFGFF